jgi:uncharacterized protein YmfQ (DUF2313 family)
VPIAALWPLPPTIEPAVRVLPGPPELGEDEFLGALQSLLPQGRAWRRDDGATITKLLRAFGLSYSRVHADQSHLLVDSFPATAEGLLDEWEQTLGLPDPCMGELPTLQQRQDAVVAKLIADGGQSIPYFTAVAATLGLTIEFTEFRDFVVDWSTVETPLFNDAPARTSQKFSVDLSTVDEPLDVFDPNVDSPGYDWSFALRITATAEPTAFFTVDLSTVEEPLESFSTLAIANDVLFEVDVNRVGDPLEIISNPVLECVLRHILPATTVPIFAYSD